MKIKHLVILFVAFSSVAFANDPAKKANNAAINTACAADGKMADCGDKQVGTGLLRCLHDYKKSHKEFALSAGCKEAIQKRQAEQKEHNKDHKPQADQKGK